MALAQRKEEPFVYTYQHYYDMPDDGNRYEIIDGEMLMMAAPSRQHQWVLGEMAYLFTHFFRGKRCKVVVAPFDVRLALYGEKKGKETNVVQPDLMVFCSRDQVDEKGGKAAPDFVAEILSQSTKNRDRQKKKRIYEKAGVREYWIVDGKKETIEAYEHDGKKFGPKKYYKKSDKVVSAVFEDFEINVADIFFDPLA